MAWLSYNCGTQGKPKTAKLSFIWSGSILVALTVQGARALHASIWVATPNHIDLRLRSQLEAHSQTLACYANPPIGPYKEHVSGCEALVGLRFRGFRGEWL